jgi:hypothetical protein
MMKEFQTAHSSPRKQTHPISSKKKNNDPNNTINFNDMNGTSTLDFNTEVDEELDIEIDFNAHINKNRPSSSSQKGDSPVLPYESGRTNFIYRYIKGFSLRNPKKIGAFYTFVVCVLPLLIVIAVLASSLDMKLLLRGSNAVDDLKSQRSFDDFHVNSTVAAIATDKALCSTIGKQIMLQGGNAMDAAVAATLCLGVISPGTYTCIHIYKSVYYAKYIHYV